ncbi:uncharacterized protein SCHCODRAFT_02753376 [Schizophyllum commune H4-8]|uniref:uncharacterized protein n=1 Tax=Schizophyllum commune (strain H4-8 / FGSC 9210) TaxID=578458 RepID=UPI00215DDEB1|nr:uncharacterized protein SCHCODRAFT_02753376 [Schizophyllum commune H4-8]KAI5886199.1 hypothetical protein SCHCODRAFT_02753376 [Schizophyllum commune H4-8]
MVPRHPMHCQSVDELIERAASVANLAMLRSYAILPPIQIATIKAFTPLLEYELICAPTSDALARKKILAQLNINRSILAPIRHLPIELLSYTFLLVMQEYPLRNLQASITISQVCSTWRTVARRQGELWTRVIVENLGDFGEYCENFLPMTKQAPLELRCDNGEILWDLWDSIASYASRWRRLKLEGRLSTLPNLKVLYMENLERLIIDAYDAPISADLSALDFVVAPRLQHIALTLDALQSDRQLHIPITRALTSLEISTLSPFPAIITLPLLQACRDTLQSLTIKILQASVDADGSYLTNASEYDPFVMKSLTHLRLVDPACSLLNHMTAPIIEELVLSAVPSYGTRSLRGFLKRGKASDHLQTLRVYNVEERDPSAWMPCLRLLENLKALHFDDLLMNKSFLEEMIIRENKPTLFPSLEGIAIWRVLWSDVELHDLIADLCTSRDKRTTIYGKDREAYTRLAWLDESWERNMRLQTHVA